MVNAALRGYAAVVLLAVIAVTLPLSAEAGTGTMELAAVGEDGPVTVFYPTAAADRPVQKHVALMLAPNAAPERGNGRLVVISHGSGGSPWVHSELARSLVAAGFTVAVPRHHRDNFRDPSRPGPESWKLRPGEVSRAIDAVAAHPVLGPLVSTQRVGVYGMSAGGHAALTLAGGRWSPAGFRRHCEAHIAQDFPACVGLLLQLRGSALDGLKTQVALGAINVLFRDDTPQVHLDARVQAVVAAVPFAADFDAASLAVPRVPLGLVLADQDRWLAPRWHGGAILAACQPRCELLAQLPTAGHGAMLSPPPPAALLSAAEVHLLSDPPGFDRAVLPAVDARITAFFRTHLLP
ncbi:MAG: alpha/beta hydrolase family protein [Ramlibacter sp.]|nr:alpha/beta hydrolase family protein [Ramlibacter sp.]